MDQDWLSRIAGFFAQCVSMTVATTSTRGSPRAADVYFVSDENLNLYFYSDPGSRHGRNIPRDPRVAVTIRSESMDWREVKGVQIEGAAARVDDPGEREKAWRLMCDKFPFYESFTDVVAHLEMYRITPQWIRWIDNSQGFGYREELTLEGR